MKLRQTDPFFLYIKKNNQIIILFLAFLFAAYCAIKIGASWDEKFHINQGKITLDYLLSLGNIDKEFLYRESYSPIYWSLLYFITKIFPSQFQIEISHLVNLCFSFATIIGLAKIGKELFNSTVGKIIFFILFFYPVFFGHMGFNNKDTILAFSHIWITYLILRYIKYQDYSNKVNKYIFSIAVLSAIATGIQLVFLGSLFPIFLFMILDIFFHKKFTSKKFSIKKFFYDIVKCFIIFYFFLILFWIDSHPNILLLPFKFLLGLLSENYPTGWPFNLINGNYYFSGEVPKTYILINFIYKSPEYILVLYLVFFISLIKYRIFFIKKFRNFNYKLLIIISLLIFPNLILFVLPYPVYDGMRLFIWTLPYFCIIPGLSIYFLIKNLKSLIPKFIFFLVSIISIYFLYDFLRMTPYQYTYLNSLNGKKENRYKKFENDYWGASIKELVKNSKLDTNSTILMSSCGINTSLAKKYFKNKGYSNLKFTSPKIADYIIMTNRTTFKVPNSKKVNNITNCFDKYYGKNVEEVKRNNQILSVIRKIEKK